MFSFLYIRFIREILAGLERAPSIESLEYENKWLGWHIIFNAPRADNDRKSSEEIGAVTAVLNTSGGDPTQNLTAQPLLEAQYYLVVTSHYDNRVFQIWIPKFFFMFLYGKAGWYEIKPIRSVAEGIFDYAPVTGLLLNGSGMGLRNPLFMDRMNKGQLIGSVHPLSGRRRDIVVPVKSNIFTFQVLPRSFVKKSDIIALVAVELKKPKTIPPSFYPRPDQKPFEMQRDPFAKIWFPGAVPVKSADTIRMHTLYPIIATTNGTLNYIAPSWKDKQHGLVPNLEFFDFLTTGESVAQVKSPDDLSSPLVTPVAGHLVSIQVLPDTLVTDGDICMYIVQE